MQITILGGGFGGVKAALELAKNKKNHITLITDKPDFQYYPALYSTATGMSHLQSWVPLGEIFGEVENVDVVIDKIEAIDADKRTLRGDSGKIYMYKTLIMALGSVTTFFGIKGLETYAYGIKSHDEIQRLKYRLYQDIAEDHHLDKNYVIVGGGPTGVELAGAMRTYIKRLCRRYNVRRSNVTIQLIEASDRLLPRNHPATSKAVKKRLQKLGVRVRTGCRVEGETATELIVDGKAIPSHTVIWTAGVANNPMYKNHEHIFTIAKNGKVEVNDHMQAAPNIYVIGDNAATKYSGLAQTALHDALFVARNLQRKATGKKMRDYRTIAPASAIPVGNNWAVFEWKNIRIYGWPAAALRRVADFVGYSDILPVGQALGAWRAGTVVEEDFYTPLPK